MISAFRFFVRSSQYLKRQISTLYNRVRYKGRITIGAKCVAHNIHVMGGGKILIGDRSHLENCSFYFEGPDNVVEIEKGCNIHGMDLIMRFGGHNYVKIGSGTSVGGSLEIECSEGTRLLIGEDCMFSHHIRIFTTDMHSILDTDGSRINKGKDVTIGNHSWIGMNAMILKGAIIPNGSILGAAVVYAGENEEQNCIFVGNPAKKVKDNITWSRERV